MFHLIGMILFGLVVGIIAKFLMPGQDGGGILITAIIGMIGSIIGTFIGRTIWGGENYGAGWIMSIIGAILVLAGYRVIKGMAS